MSETALYTTISVVENCLSCACRLSVVRPPPVCLQFSPLCVPVLYQSVRLGIGVVALFQVSSGVQQWLLGSAELGSLCLGKVSWGGDVRPDLAPGLSPLPDIPVGEGGGSSWLPLLHLPGRGHFHGGGFHGRWPLQGAAPLGLQAGLAHCSSCSSCPDSCFPWRTNTTSACSRSSSSTTTTTSSSTSCSSSTAAAATAAAHSSTSGCQGHATVQQEVHTEIRRQVDQLSPWEGTHRRETRDN